MEKIENLRNRISVKLVSNKKDYLKWTSKPSYMSHKMLDNDLVAVRKNKVTLTLTNKPAYIGMCILELGKALMYKFHYDYIKNKYGNDSRILFTVPVGDGVMFKSYSNITITTNDQCLLLHLGISNFELGLC